MKPACRVDCSPEFNIMAAIIFTNAGIRTAAQRSFSHFTWGTETGQGVFIGGIIMTLVGVYLFTEYFKKNTFLLWKLKLIYALIIIISVMGTVLMLVFSLPVWLRVGFILTPFVLGHYLHAQLKGVTANPGSEAEGL
jgi:low temperature requirement protein LtrA